MGSRRVLVGRVLSTLAILFLLFDSSLKVMSTATAVEGTVQLGYPQSTVVVIGVIQLACVILYAVPRTAVLGAIVLTGYLGGAIATHVRVSSPLLGYTLFPIYIAVLIWGGLFLREDRLRSLVPLRRS
jgi:hypothetical protein